MNESCPSFLTGSALIRWILLEAAGTKWNFLPFRPGLIGGHCIGVDPYYLTFKADELGCHPQVILAGAAYQRRHGQRVWRKPASNC